MKLQLKRSNVLENGSAKKPDAVQMDYGELAVNYNSSDPTIFLKDSNNTIVKIGADDYLSVEGGTVTGNVDITGDVTAASFTGDGSGLTNMPVDTLQSVTDAGNTTTNGATFGGTVTAGNFNVVSLPALP